MHVSHAHSLTTLEVSHILRRVLITNRAAKDPEHLKKWPRHFPERKRIPVLRHCRRLFSGNIEPLVSQRFHNKREIKNKTNTDLACCIWNRTKTLVQKQVTHSGAKLNKSIHNSLEQWFWSSQQAFSTSGQRQ